MLPFLFRSDFKFIDRMKMNNKLLILADKLVDNELESEAEQILAQIFELNNIRNVQVITPEHPIYPVLFKMLKPEEVIQDKLVDFSNRLGLES